LRDAATAALHAYADAEEAAGGSRAGDAAGGGADVLVPLLCALLCAPGCAGDVLTHLEFIDRFLLLNGAPPGCEDPRKSELGYLLISFGAAAEYVRHAGRTAQPLTAATAKKQPAAARKPATHARHASAPSMLLELVDLREPPASSAVEDAADAPPAAAVRPWLAHFGRWRLPVRTPAPVPDEALDAPADTAAQ
jgi:hypothetical protein